MSDTRRKWQTDDDGVRNENTLATACSDTQEKKQRKSNPTNVRARRKSVDGNQGRRSSPGCTTGTAERSDRKSAEQERGRGRSRSRSSRASLSSFVSTGTRHSLLEQRQRRRSLSASGRRPSFTPSRASLSSEGSLEVEVNRNLCGTSGEQHDSEDSENDDERINEFLKAVGYEQQQVKGEKKSLKGEKKSLKGEKKSLNGEKRSLRSKASFSAVSTLWNDEGQRAKNSATNGASPQPQSIEARSRVSSQSDQCDDLDERDLIRKPVGSRSSNKTEDDGVATLECDNSFLAERNENMCNADRRGNWKRGIVLDGRNSPTYDVNLGMKKDTSTAVDENLSSAISMAQEHSSRCLSLQMELNGVKESTKELKSENDELANEVQDMMEDNRVLTEALEGKDETIKQLRRQVDSLLETQYKLEDDLERHRSGLLEPAEMAEELEHVRQESNRLLKLAASERKELNLKVQMLTSERDEMEQKMLRVVDEKRKLIMENETLRSSVDRSRVLLLEKHRKLMSYENQEGNRGAAVSSARPLRRGSVGTTNSELTNDRKASEVRRRFSLTSSQEVMGFFDRKEQS